MLVRIKKLISLTDQLVIAPTFSNLISVFDKYPFDCPTSSYVEKCMKPFTKGKVPNNSQSEDNSNQILLVNFQKNK